MKLFTKPLPGPLTGPSKDSGFTFIELIMTIVILGVLAAYATPRFSSTSDFSVAGAAEVVASDVTYTQREAMSTRQSLDITYIDTNTYTYVSNTTRDINDISADVTVSFGTETISASADPITFNSLGEPTFGFTKLATATKIQRTITVQEGAVLKCIVVEPYTGKVTIEDCP